MRLAALALALLLAGCAASPKESQPGTSGDAAAPDVQAVGGEVAALGGPVAQHQPGAFGPEAVTGVAGPLSDASYNFTLDVDVGKGATGLVAELVWADAASDLDLMVQSPKFCEVPVERQLPCITNAFFGDPSGTGAWRNGDGLPTQGDSPSRIVLTAADLESAGCDGCTWTLLAMSKATAGTAFDLYATVFYGSPPPDGYSAVTA